MCGVFGIVFFNEAPEKKFLQSRLNGVLEALRPRGPDGAGLWIHPSGRVALAHTRLAILDLSQSAAQPMLDRASGSALSFNGEIYNFKELRSEVGAGEWTSSGDSEVLLKGLVARGEAFVERLNGMYAFGFWDETRQELVLGTDPAGEKPLYTYRDADVFVFASEISALHESGFVPRAPDRDAIQDYLFFGYVPAPRTFWSGVKKFPAASVQTVRLGGGAQAPRAYWDIPLGRKYRGKYADAQTELRSLLRASVERRLVADVPVGCFLSGGLDSSVIALEASRRRRVETFSVGFDTELSSLYDESPYAREVARRLKSRHHEIRVSAGASDAESALAAFDDLYADSSAIPTSILCRETAKSVKVALSGDGGDELFGGYLRFRAATLSENWRSVLKPLLTAFRTGTAHPRSMRGYAGRFKEALDLPLLERVARWNSFFNEADLARAFGRRAESIMESVHRHDAKLKGVDDGTKVLYLNFKTYLFDDLLPKVDRTSLRHGLEVRAPFLDRSLIEFAFSLPTAWKFTVTHSKRVLKDAYRIELGGDIVDRKKQGFAFPLEDLIDLKRLDCPEIAKLVGRSAVERLIDKDDASNRNHASRSFALWSAENLLGRQKLIKGPVVHEAGSHAEL